MSRVLENGVERPATPAEEAELVTRYVNWVAEQGRLRVPTIKQLADQLITKELPRWQQTESLARLIELNEKRILLIPLSGAEQSELAALKADWSWINQVRAETVAAENAGTEVKDVVFTPRR